MMHLINNWLLTGGGSRKIAIFLELLFGVSGLRALESSIRNLIRSNGSSFTVTYLKECKRVVEFYCCGRPVTLTLGPPLVGLRSGLPSIVPAGLRDRIRDGDRVTIMLVLSLFGIARGLVVPPNIKVETITDGYAGEADHLMGISDIADRFMGALQIGKLRRPRLWLSTSVGPHGLTGSVSAIRDAASLISGQHETIRLFMREFCDTVYGRKYRIWLDIMIRYFAFVHWVLFPSWVAQAGVTSWLSRLHRIEEPAGKVRIVAITDYWTQLLMKPIHDLVFDTLRAIPQDGTFDQEACVTRLLNRVKELRDAGEVYTAYSYDLSAATDRMPVHLYQELLARIIGHEGATLWKHLLTARKWWDRDSAWTPDQGLKPRGEWIARFYAVGQPMGAYSSWAMLALAHHALVQYSAGLVGRYDWFEDYGIVGDDIVILDPIVAKRYREVMLDLGVQISEEKSLISDLGVFEFCKRLVTPDGDVSGIPIKLLYQAFRYPSDAAVLIRHLYRRHFSLLPIAVTRAFSSLSARSVRLEKPIRSYPVSIRVALATMVQPAFPWWRGIWLLVHILRLSVVELHEVLETQRVIPTDEMGAYGKLETTSFQGWLDRLRPGKWSDSLLRVSPGISRMLLKSERMQTLKRKGYIVAGVWGPIQLVLLWGTPLGWWLVSDTSHRLWDLAKISVWSLLESMTVPGSMSFDSGFVFFRKRVRDRVLENYRSSQGGYLAAVAKARTQPSFDLTLFPPSIRKERIERKRVAWIIKALSKYEGTLPPYYGSDDLPIPR
jgi:hypothetical protein